MYPSTHPSKRAAPDAFSFWIGCNVNPPKNRANMGLLRAQHPWRLVNPPKDLADSSPVFEDLDCEICKICSFEIGEHTCLSWRGPSVEQWELVGIQDETSVSAYSKRTRKACIVNMMPPVSRRSKQQVIIPSRKTKQNMQQSNLKKRNVSLAQGGQPCIRKNI